MPSCCLRRAVTSGVARTFNLVIRPREQFAANSNLLDYLPDSVLKNLDTRDGMNLPRRTPPLPDAPVAYVRFVVEEPPIHAYLRRRPELIPAVPIYVSRIEADRAFGPGSHCFLEPRGDLCNDVLTAVAL